MGNLIRRARPLAASVTLAIAVLAAAAAPAAASVPLRPVLLQEVVPGTPVGLTASGVTDTEVTILWYDTSGGTADFGIQRRTLDGAFEDVATTPAGTTQWTDTGLSPQTPYEYRVCAYVDGVPTDYTDVLAVSTLPIPPVGLAVSDASYKEVSLSWSDPGAGAAGFDIQRREPGGEFVTIATVSAGITEWTDTTVQPETTYEYRICATIDDLCSGYTPPVMAVTGAIPTPVAPGALVAEVLSPNSVSLSWEDRSEDEIQFQVFRGADGAMPVLVASLMAGTTSWTDEGVAADRTYSYTVRAVGVAGPSSPSAAVVVYAPASFSLEVLKGKRIDSAKSSKDALDVTFAYVSLTGGALPDPRTASFALGMGPVGGQVLVSLPANDAGWKERKGIYTWKSPKGAVVKATITVDPVKGTIRFKATHLNLGGIDPAEVRTWFRCGTEAGSDTGAWTVKKNGLLVL